MKFKTKNEFHTRLEAGPLFVRIINGVKTGTVGIVESASLRSDYWSRNKDEITVEESTVRIKVEGKRSFTEEFKFCSFLDGTDHRQEYHHSLNNAPVTMDVFGTPIEIGTTVAFAEKKFICVGLVSRITPKGGVFVKCLRVGNRKGDGMEIRIPDAADGTFVIKQDSLSDIMLAKLSE